MRRKMFVALLAVAIVIAMAGGALAAGTLTSDVVVNAQVKSVCTQQQLGNFALADIQIDPSAAGLQTFTPSADEILKCSKNDSILIQAQTNNGTSALTNCDPTTGVGGDLTGTGGLTIAYTLTCANADATGHVIGTGFGSTNPLGLRVNISQAAASVADVAGNNYQDTVKITVTY
jgi:hypothetical protein